MILTFFSNVLWQKFITKNISMKARIEYNVDLKINHFYVFIFKIRAFKLNLVQLNLGLFLFYLWWKFFGFYRFVLPIFWPGFVVFIVYFMINSVKHTFFYLHYDWIFNFSFGYPWNHKIQTIKTKVKTTKSRQDKEMMRYFHICGWKLLKRE